MSEAETNDLSYWKVDDPRGAVGQTRATALMRFDKRASYKHFALLDFHWGWAHKKYDWTSLASVRNIHATLKARNPLGEASMSSQHINSGNRDLVEWGWLFELEKGAGRSATRFLPNYALFHIAAEGKFRAFLNRDVAFSVNPIGDRNGYGISVHPMGDASVTYEVNANRLCVHPLGDKDPLTETGLQDRSTERGIDCAAPSAPPLSGLKADKAGAAQGGFEELWKAYACRQKKKEAQAEYDKLSPGPEQHTAMVLAASKWRSAWEAQNKADAPRFTLARWIEREEFECEPPTAYKSKAKAERPVKPAAVTKTQPEPANDNEDAIHVDGPMVNDVGPFTPWGSFDAEIIDAEVCHIDAYTERVVLALKWNDKWPDPDAHHTLYYQHSDQATQARGQQFIATLASIAGIGDITDTDQLVGCRVRCKVNDRYAISYEAAA